MRIRALTLVLGFFILSNAYAQEAINISGTQIPIIEGAKSIDREAMQPREARIATYATEKTSASVIMFYESFFKNNGYLIIGGKKDDEFDASCKKENTMFTLRIYSKDSKAIIQFIW